MKFLQNIFIKLKRDNPWQSSHLFLSPFFRSVSLLLSIFLSFTVCVSFHNFNKNKILFIPEAMSRSMFLMCSLCWPLVNGHKPVGADTRKEWRKGFSRDVNPTSSKRFSFPTIKMLWRLAFHLRSFYIMNTFTICSSAAKGRLTLSIRRIKHTWPYDNYSRTSPLKMFLCFCLQNLQSCTDFTKKT